MIEEELIKIWQSSPNQEQVKFEKSRLMLEVQTSVDRFHREIRNRDLRELLGGVIAIPVFAAYAYYIPFMITKIASLLIIVWGVFVVIRLQMAKRHKPGAFSETYLEYLHKTRDYLMLQKRLLDNVLYWYILPGMFLIFLFVMGQGLEGRLPKVIIICSIIAAMGVFINDLNKKAVKKEFIPRLDKVNELIKTMEKP